MRYCGPTNIPQTDNDPLECTSVYSSDCVMTPYGIEYLNYTGPTKVTEVFNYIADKIAEVENNSINKRHENLLGLDTDDHLQYHTDARALAWLNTRSTDDLPEGLSNFYFTEDRVLNTTLTGFVAAPGTITDTDTVLTALQKSQGNSNNYSRVIYVYADDLSGNGTLEEQLAEYVTALGISKEEVDSDHWVEYNSANRP